ncbi:LamG domain-containing protein [Glycomyces luteolus]|uniref:LamG domain-containing protein n=1 Tax=Glycomyces luteolus TaxID=2670330 RepID=A0A9X3P6S1_9ACTN|nr:LamG domain-containing protein [Glycomyces luteolus]MDA1359287.1 LamG domain-containing protein [Glycomyces luteolus]
MSLITCASSPVTIGVETVAHFPSHSHPLTGDRTPVTSPRPRRRLRQALIVGLASVTIFGTVRTLPALGQEADDAACADSEGLLQESDESAALDLAVACDAEVLIGDSWVYDARSLAQPDGTIATEFYAEPQWVPDGNGEWTDVDPTVAVADDGSLRSTATVADLEFGTAGEFAFVSATGVDGEKVSLNWPEPLPEPELNGATVVYPEVLPGVDLEVYSDVSDFSYALVVKTPEAAESEALDRIELGLETEGLTVDADAEANTAVLTDAEGEPAFSVANPWMWDSSGIAEEAPDLAAEMDLEIEADSLAVVPDQNLLTDPEAVYPIYIDPEFTYEGPNFENAFSEGTGITCGTGSEMCTGTQTWSNDPTYGYWRSAMKFNGLGVLANRDIQQATVWVTQTHTGAAGATHTVRLYSMDWFDFAANTSWNTFNGKLVGQVASASVATSNGPSGEPDRQIQWADTRTANRIQTLVDGGSTTAVFAVISGANGDQEANRNYWRKLNPSTGRLKVWHGPLKPTNLKTGTDNCSTSAPGPVINTLTPTLYLTAPPALETSNKISFYVYERDGVHPNAIQQIDVGNVIEKQVVSATVAVGELTRGKTYRWQARAWDSDSASSRYSDFTSYCYFTVNQLPTTPTNLTTANLGCGTQTSPTLVTTSAPLLYATPSDPDGGNVTTWIQAYNESGTLLKEYKPAGKSGVTASATTSAADGLYKWRAATSDLFATSAWSGYCWVRVDTTAPAPPDVVQVTETPSIDNPVVFDLVGDAEVKSFKYSFNSGAVQSIAATGGTATISVTPTGSSINFTLEVWASDAAVGVQGNTSSKTVYVLTVTAPQPAEAIGVWRFDGDSLDDAGEQTLTPLGTAITGPDAQGRPDAAAVFDGNSDSCLATTGPVVDTTSSFTIAGWVKTDAAPATEVAFMDVAGVTRSNMKFLMTSAGRWGIAMISEDGDAATSTSVQADPALTQFGQWTHLAGVYDAAAGRLRLYVNGVLASSKPLPFTAWKATGVFSVGCGVSAQNGPFSPFTGSVDEAVLFQQPLTGDQVAGLMTGRGLPAALQAWYPLRGDGLDRSGRGADLTGLPASPTWVADQHGRSASALQLDGATCPTAGEVPVRTDAAFSASAWVKLDSDHLNSHPRVFSFDGANAFAVMAKYNATSDKWSLSVTAADAVGSAWGEGATSSAIAAEELWNQITVTVDPASNQVQLFVNGEFSDDGKISTTWSPWRAGQFTVGCGEPTNGSQSGQWQGAISDVRVWRGVLSAEEIASAHTSKVSAWALDELGTSAGTTDEWGANTLAFNGTYEFGVDRRNSCESTLQLAGEGWAQTTGPVLTTDESFTIASWARVDDLDGYRTVAMQSGTAQAAFEIGYNPEFGAFQMSMAQRDSTDTTWARVLALEAPEMDPDTGLGKWYHLVGQVDLGAGVIRLFVDGQMQGEVPIVDSPWRATGSLTVGSSAQRDGVVQHMVGAIDNVQTWSGVLDEDSIARLSRDRPDSPLNPNDVYCPPS